MKLHPLALTLLAPVYVFACSGKPPEPSETPNNAAAPSASASATETATASEAAEAAPSASSAPAAPEASATPGAAPSSAPAEPSKAEGKKSAKKESDKSSGQSEAAAGGYTGDDPCQTKNFHYGQVKAACHSGGRPAVKGVMKGVVQKAKAAGEDIKCTACHEDMKSFALKSNAVADLKKWL